MSYVTNLQLENYINKYLKSQKINDCCPNGLQIEGSKCIYSLITGVSICKKLIVKAIHMKSDAIIVHHGCFWENEAMTICGEKRDQIKLLLAHNINLFAWHLPIDMHKKIGNNAKFGSMLGVKYKKQITPFVWFGEFDKHVEYNFLIDKLENNLNRKPIHYTRNKIKKLIKKLAWSTGNGKHFTKTIAKFDVDAYITGEMPEYVALDLVANNDIHLFIAGHHATETFGVRALGEWITDTLKINATFINID